VLINDATVTEDQRALAAYEPDATRADGGPGSDAYAAAAAEDSYGREMVPRLAVVSDTHV
jgi:hypothetical protein